MKCLIIIPAYNESANLEEVIVQLRKCCPFADLLVVNDCSTDDTEKVLEEMKAAHLRFPLNLGIGGAVQAGYIYAMENEYDIAIQHDGDGQHDPAEIFKAVKMIERDEADIIIGSRFILKDGYQSSTTRRIGIRLLSNLIFALTLHRVHDVTSGYRIINRRFIEIYSNDYPPDYPEPEAIISAFMYGGRIKEIPVIMRERQSGKSSINLGKSIYYMIKVTLAVLICRISFGIRRG